MKHIRTLFPSLAIIAGFFISSVAVTHAAQKKDEPAAASPAAKGKLVPVTEKEAAWAAKARAAYPMSMCVASDEKLEAGDKSAEFIYRETGKPDRLVIFCCEGCGDDFMKDPAKYLAKLDAAAKSKAAAVKKS